MAIEIKVPDIGDFKDVPVIEVLVKPGDAVKKEDSLVTLESDKATMEVPSSHAGTVKELRVKVGTLTGGAWVFGRDTNEVVFRDRGTYRVRGGNDMETDGPIYAECLVTFEPNA